MSPLENVLLIVISYKDKYDLDFFKWTQYIKTEYLEMTDYQLFAVNKVEK